MESSTSPTIIPVEGLGEAAAAAQNLALQPSVLGPIDPGTTLGMYPPSPILIEP
ncbi:MAG TPA: hypothetical protein VF665_17010 [Longimicrobium sp.]|jgi:hypothetical protein|uniref:hypothetical protein n=1 Tax=Longimicrobium sp. TaxID=2029185 RepID=UPI002EDAFAC8